MKLVSALVIATVAASGTNSLASNKLQQCDAQNPSLMGVGLLMSIHFLAKHVCGHRVKPLEPTLLKLLSDQGCHAGSETFDQTMDGWSRVKDATLLDFAVEGGPNKTGLTEADARKGMLSVVETMGGCENIGRGLAIAPPEEAK